MGWSKCWLELQKLGSMGCMGNEHAVGNKVLARGLLELVLCRNTPLQVYSPRRTGFFHRMMGRGWCVAKMQNKWAIE